MLAQGFRQDRILTLTDDKATKAAIERLLGDQLRQQVGANDRLLVFFAGHGKTDQLRSGEEEGYLIPVDGDPNQLFSTAISMTALRQISDRLRAKHILYIVDACYSGYAIFNRSMPRTTSWRKWSRNPPSRSSRPGGSRTRPRSAPGTECSRRSWSGAWSATPFRETERGLPWRSSGLWVKQRVFAESNKKQLPQYGNLSGEGQFVFRRAGPAVGSLAVTGKVADVEVWLGDRKLGDTARGGTLLAPDLPVGTYQLTARKAGHKDWTRTVEVAANQQVDIAIGFEELGYPKEIVSDDGAEMVLIPPGDFWMGNTPEGLGPVRDFCTAESSSGRLQGRALRTRRAAPPPRHPGRVLPRSVRSHECTICGFREGHGAPDAGGSATRS